MSERTQHLIGMAFFLTAAVLLGFAGQDGACGVCVCVAILWAL
jgi:hypothetical protein